MQAEEQVVQLDTDAGGAVFALVAESEENIGLAAVPVKTRTVLSLCADQCA